MAENIAPLLPNNNAACFVQPCPGARWCLSGDFGRKKCRDPDFAHRARAAGWSLEEVAYYLGHITKSGMPAIQTTIRYTQVSREHVKEKLKLLRG